MEFTGKFIFEKYETHLEKGEAIFHYRVERSGETREFMKSLYFPPADTTNIPQQILESIFQSLLILFGMSYWKLWCPRELALPGIALTKKQADFWNVVYTKGLGEFYYKNNLDFRGLVHFPVTAAAITPAPILPRQNRSLLLIGGGKDSIVSLNFLTEAQKNFTPFLMSPKKIQLAVLPKSLSPLVMQRRFEPSFKELNQLPDAFNGHVPISTHYMLTAVLAAILYDYQYVVCSNERSANVGNLEYLGQTINHQWSKSLEFEKLFADYVQRFITPSITPFSLLRPLSEIQIAKLFAEKGAALDTFTSCNTNFRMTTTAGQPGWCGKCPKCAFVFAILAPYLSKQKLVSIFGKNLFADAALISLYQELLGLTGIKPFECVGTPEETALAFELTHDRGEYEEDAVMKMYLANRPLTQTKKKELLSSLFTPSTEHVIPQDFSEIITTLRAK